MAAKSKRPANIYHRTTVTHNGMNISSTHVCRRV